jgi:hypothetical protein
MVQQLRLSLIYRKVHFFKEGYGGRLAHVHENQSALYVEPKPEKASCTQYRMTHACERSCPSPSAATIQWGGDIALGYYHLMQIKKEEQKFRHRETSGVNQLIHSRRMEKAKKVFPTPGIEPGPCRRQPKLLSLRAANPSH